MALRCNLNCLPIHAIEPASDTSEVSRRSAKIVIRHHHTRGRKRARKFAPGKLLCRFDFNIAPVAAGADRLRQDFNLLFPAALKQPSPLFPPARCNPYGAPAFAAEPRQENFPLPRTSKIIQAQFQRARLAQAYKDMRPHLSRRSSGDDAAHPIFSEETLQAPSTPEAKL